MVKFKVFNYFGLLLGLVWHLWVGLVCVFATLIFGLFISIFSYRDAHFKWAYLFMLYWAKTVFYASGFWYEFHNPQALAIDKNTQYIFISNHTSVMDICLMIILHPQHLLCFVGKKELAKTPLFGKIYKRVAVLVDRQNEQSRMSVYKRCATKMGEGKSIVIYPEGGVSDDASVVLQEFKDGAFVLATEHQFPIAVYTFVGLKEKFPFSFTHGRPGKINVVLNAILSPNQTRQELKEKSYYLIKNTLELEK